MPPPDESKAIIWKLFDIVKQVINEDLEKNVKLMEWLERKFQDKVDEKIFGEITLSQVQPTTKIE